MTDEIKMGAAPIAPLVVTMVGSSGTGNGELPQGTVAKTPDHLPNVVVNFIGPVFALAIRFTNFYLTTLVGLIPAALTPKGGEVMNALGAKDFFQVVVACGSIALAPAILDLIKNLVTIFGKLEKDHPILTGSV